MVAIKCHSSRHILRARVMGLAVLDYFMLCHVEALPIIFKSILLSAHY